MVRYIDLILLAVWIYRMFNFALDREWIEASPAARIPEPGDALFTNALGINARGEIVGRYCTVVPCEPENRHGFLRTRHGEFETIDAPGAIGTNAWKISPRGQIVGAYTGADGETHVFLLREGDFTTIPLPAAAAIALENGGINRRGDIVGVYCDTEPCGKDFRGFLWSKDEFTTIDFPGAIGTGAFAINARGDIVGFYDDTSLDRHGFLLSRKERDD